MGSGDILPVYTCGTCNVIIEPTTEKVVEIILRGKKWLGVHCTACAEDMQNILERRIADAFEVKEELVKVAVKVVACYSLYTVENSEQKQQLIFKKVLV